MPAVPSQPSTAAASHHHRTWHNSARNLQAALSAISTVADRLKGQYRTMKNACTALVGLLAASGAVSASAVAFSVGPNSINIPTALNFEVASLYENIVTGVGQTARGMGEI